MLVGEKQNYKITTKGIGKRKWKLFLIAFIFINLVLKICKFRNSELELCLIFQNGDINGSHVNFVLKKVTKLVLFSHFIE